MKWPRLIRPPQRRVRHVEHVLGTALEVQLLADSAAQLDAAEAALFAEIDRLEQVFSRFLPGSELNCFLARGKRGMAVSPDFAALLSQAQHFMTLTSGAFQPASDALTRLWAAGEPDAAALTSVLARLQEPLWTLTGEQATLHTPLGLNFNAHAKGYIADAAAQSALDVPGVRAVLLNLGGDVRHLGESPVRVGVQAPGHLADNRAPLLTLSIRNQAVATSGQAHRGAHLLSPRTGRPTAKQRAVSVLAPTCAGADALSTALCVLDLGEGLTLADTLPGVGMLVLDGGAQHANALWRHHQRSPLTPL